jgi:hypothetical protein
MKERERGKKNGINVASGAVGTLTQLGGGGEEEGVKFAF